MRAEAPNAHANIITASGTQHCESEICRSEKEICINISRSGPCLQSGDQILSHHGTSFYNIPSVLHLLLWALAYLLPKWSYSHAIKEGVTAPVISPLDRRLWFSYSSHLVNFLEERGRMHLGTRWISQFACSWGSFDLFRRAKGGVEYDKIDLKTLFCGYCFKDKCMNWPHFFWFVKTFLIF